MSTKSKRANRISPTTVILVLVLLAAVAGASRLVTPPPAQPPAEQTKPAVVDAAKEKQMIEAQKLQEKERMQQMKEHMNSAAAKVPKVEDPNAIDITPDYFLHHKPGEAGLKQVDTEMVKKKAAYEAYRKQIEASQAATAKPVEKAVPSNPH